MSSTKLASNLSRNARKVVEQRYSHKDPQGNPTEDWEDICKRVVAHVAQAEEDPKEKAEFANKALKLMLERKFVPNTPCLVNAGTEEAQLSACFVVDMEDSMKSIMKMASDCASIHQSGGGTGFSISRLRPADSLVRGGKRGKASGPVSFMQIVDAVTNTVKQGGVRRGANLATIQCDHPDILRFIHCKNNQTDFLNFNISVGITDEFMQAVETKEWVRLRFAGNDWYGDAFDPKSGTDYEWEGIKQSGYIYAPDVWNRIIESTWQYGEPGVLFLDTHNKNHTLLNTHGPIRSTNPCVTADTLIDTPIGLRRVDQIKAGDKIITVSGVGEVARVEVYKKRPISLITFSNGKTLRATAAHQFHSKTAAGWVPRRLDSLKVGSLIRTKNGSTNIQSIQPAGLEDVFDLYEPTTDTWITNGVVSRGCGEQFLNTNNSCVLGSIDVSKYFTDSKFDWETFRKDIPTAIQFLDNVITTSQSPTPEIEKVTKDTRPVGLGIMGLADLLIKENIVYGSEASLDYVNQLMEKFQVTAWKASQDLAATKGPFVGYEANKELINAKLDSLGLDPRRVRNYQVTCIAPTGTISLVAETSSGMEPLFDIAHVRKDTVGTRTYVHPLAAEALRIDVDWNDEESVTNAAQEVSDRRTELPGWFVTAHDLSPEEHIHMLATCQKWVDNSISKTINAPHDYTVEQTKQAHELAYKLGVKAVSFYRDGSRVNQVLTSMEKKEEKAEPEEPLVFTADPEVIAETSVRGKAGRPAELTGSTWKIPFNGKPLFVTVNHDGKRVTECFALGPISPSVGRLVSTMLADGYTTKEISDLLRKETGTYSTWFQGHAITSPEEAIAACLEITTGRLGGSEAKPVVAQSKGLGCSECGGVMVVQNGCAACLDCGYSKCS